MESWDQDIYDDVREWLRVELKKMLEEELAKKPWWCMMCGAFGNHEGPEPPAYGTYWFPPKDHVCPEVTVTPVKQGITMTNDIHHMDDLLDRCEERDIDHNGIRRCIFNKNHIGYHEWGMYA